MITRIELNGYYERKDGMLTHLDGNYQVVRMNEQTMTLVIYGTDAITGKRFTSRWTFSRIPVIIPFVSDTGD